MLWAGKAQESQSLYGYITLNIQKYCIMQPKQISKLTLYPRYYPTPNFWAQPKVGKEH